MSYYPELEKKWMLLTQWMDLYKERGGDTDPYIEEAQQALSRLTKKVCKEVERSEANPDEPSLLADIRALRPRGPRRLELSLTDKQLEDKLRGAWLGRAAGCILGIPPEGLSRNAIRHACKSTKQKYPLTDYWTIDPKAMDPEWLHYGITPRKYFMKDKLTFTGSDDDLVYTLIGLLILEEYGLDFTSEDVGQAWKDYITIACTAEEIALQNLEAEVPINQCGTKNNPYRDWIGADIRSDPWAYAAPGWLEKAAEFAHRDAWISHRAAGIHGAMLYSAAIAAAFAVDDPIEAIELGLTEIPRRCRVAQTVKQAIRWCEKDQDWEKTMLRIEKRFAGMNMAHTLNNAAITVAGLYYGEKNFQKTIALTVMGGVDTDCNAASAGSILGAISGAKKLPKKWTQPLGKRVQSNLRGKELFTTDRIVKRFHKIAKKVLQVAE